MTSCTEQHNLAILNDARGYVWEPPDMLRSLFESLEVPILGDTLAARSLSETASREDIDTCCRVAAIRWSDDPQVGARCLNGSGPGAIALAEVIDHLKFQIFYTLTGDILDEDDESVTVKTPRGPLVTTPESLRRWEWMLTLLTDPKAARELLLQAPPASVAQADQAAAHARDTDFASLVEPPEADR